MMEWKLEFSAELQMRDYMQLRYEVGEHGERKGLTFRKEINREDSAAWKDFPSLW